MTARDRRWVVLSCLLAVSAWLAFFGDKTANDPAEIARPIAHPPSPEPRDAGRPSEVLTALIPRSQLIRPTPKTSTDLFSPRVWTPPILVAPAPPPMAPRAPALPFAYAGKKREGGRWEVYLLQGEFSFVAREGDTLANTYLVQRIEPPLMTLLYRPLQEVQSMSIGE